MERPRHVQVIATTAEGTRTALAEAKRLSSRVDPAPIVLLVPHIVSSSRPLESPQETTHLAAQYKHLAAAAGIDATVRVCLCRGYGEALRWMVGERAVIVIGGRRRWWWPTTAQWMARDLKRAGHSVVFAVVGQDGARMT